MPPDMGRHGYLLLCPHTGALDYQETQQALMALGFGQFSGERDDGRPAFVVLDTHSSKPAWFEAGFWAGAGVPLFAVGVTFRKRHFELLRRLGGWAVSVSGIADLTAAVGRRGLVPTAWDAARIEEALAAIVAQQQAETLARVSENAPPNECPGHGRGGTAEPCCGRAGEYNGFGSDGPLSFRCPKGCSCHD